VVSMNIADRRVGLAYTRVASRTEPSSPPDMARKSCDIAVVGVLFDEDGHMAKEGLVGGGLEHQDPVRATTCGVVEACH